MYYKITRQIIFLALVFILLPTNISLALGEVFTFKDVPKSHWSEDYIYRLKFLGAVQGKNKDTFGFDKNITRAEFTTMLMRLVGQDCSSNNSTNVFVDILNSHWAYPYIDKAVKQGIISPQDYPYMKFNPDGNISRIEMAIMTVRALKCENLLDLAKNSDSGFKDVTVFKNYIFVAKNYGIIKGQTPTKFNPNGLALKQETAAMMVRLIDILYKRDTYPITLINPIAGHQYKSTDKLHIEVTTPNDISGFIEKIEIEVNSNKVVNTLTSYPYTCGLDVSSLSSGYHAVKAIAYTKDGFKLESFPVTINLSKSDSDGFERYRTANKEEVFNSHVYLENKYSLINRLEPTSSNDRKLLISNNPERIYPETRPVLFDSNKQSGNFRLMFYHENQLPSSIVLGAEIENLSTENLYITENAAYCAGLYGNSAGFYSQSFFMKVRNGEHKDAWDPNLQIRKKVYTIPPRSKMIIFQDGITSKKVASYIGDFDVAGTGSYIVKVGYAKPNQVNALSKVFESGLLADSDHLHSRGVFDHSDFDMSVDLSVPNKNIIFQLGNDNKSFDSEANIHPRQIGYSQDGIVVNDGHFGELFNINLENPDEKPFSVAIEFRGSNTTCPSFPVYYDSSGHTNSMIVSKETAMYLDKQLIIEKTSEKQVKFTLCIPPGMNGPLYMYIIKDVQL